jgi:uncharacterized RDD family membrane protein YckC
VKCPKCHYLGFETGDRCKNCGYDFSLMDDPDPSIEPDLDIELAFRDSDDTLPASVQWDDQFEHMDADALADAAALAESPTALEIADPNPEPPPEPSPQPPAMPVERKVRSLGSASLFESGDEPLIKVPAAPRPPLAVRRTPETPRLRAVPRPVPKPSRPIESSPVLDFVAEPAPEVGAESVADVRARTASRLASRPVAAEVGGSGPRLAAAAIDHLLLGAIDLAVVYFTLRMTGLTLAGLSMLPPVPLIAFLLLVKLSYFAAFTAVGGQTIGKMAMRLRVVTADNETVDGALAVKRALAGFASAVTLGAGFLPALFGSERRALHDRLTRTRVVTLPSA